NLVGDGESGGDFFMMNYLIGPGQGDTGAIRPHFFGTSTTALTTTNPDVLALNTTYHVVTTWDRAAGTGNIYFNGALVLSGPVPGEPVNTANAIFIGRDGRENRPSNFRIDEVALYDYPLTDAQILNHYNIGLNLGPPARFEITEITYDDNTGVLKLTWNSSPVDSYRVESSRDLVRWEELDDGIASDGRSTTEAFDLNLFFPTGIPAKLYFRVLPE
ncbi:MAG: LamG domain-containing protein, partial [Verrucomicrobiales bacterium]